MLVNFQKKPIANDCLDEALSGILQNYYINDIFPLMYLDALNCLTHDNVVATEPRYMKRYIADVRKFEHLFGVKVTWHNNCGNKTHLDKVIDELTKYVPVVFMVDSYRYRWDNDYMINHSSHAITAVGTENDRIYYIDTHYMPYVDSFAYSEFNDLIKSYAIITYPDEKNQFDKNHIISELKNNIMFSLERNRNCVEQYSSYVATEDFRETYMKEKRYIFDYPILENLNILDSRFTIFAEGLKCMLNHFEMYELAPFVKESFNIADDYGSIWMVFYKSIKKGTPVTNTQQYAEKLVDVSAHSRDFLQRLLNSLYR